MPGLSGETLCDLPKISSLRSIAEVKDFILKIVFVVNTEGFNLDVSAVGKNHTYAKCKPIDYRYHSGASEFTPYKTLVSFRYCTVILGQKPN